MHEHAKLSLEVIAELIGVDLRRIGWWGDRQHRLLFGAGPVERRPLLLDVLRGHAFEVAVKGPLVIDTKTEGQGIGMLLEAAAIQRP